MSKAKVSILVPTYNVEQYLVECMESIVNQTLKEIEIICINDGSTDGSLAILEDYAKKDDRVIIINKKNTGYGNSMNLGLDKATGEYIGIVEPDDYVELDMYEKLYKLAVEHDVDVIKADFTRFIGEPENRKFTLNELMKDKSYYNRVINPKEEKQVFRAIMNTWSGIYKRDMIEKYHIRHNETPGASFQDNGFWFQTFTRATRIYFSDYVLYMNRRDNVNSSVKSKDKVYCMNEEYAYIKEYLNKNPEIKEEFIYQYSIKKYHNYLFTFNRIGLDFKRQYIKDISKELKEAFDQGEFDLELFTERERNDFLLLLEDANVAYLNYELRAERSKIHELNVRLKKQEKEIKSLKKKLKNNTSFFGKLAKKVKRLFKKK